MISLARRAAIAAAGAARRRGGAPAPVLAYAAPGSTADYYTVAHADAPPGSMPGTLYGVIRRDGAPGATAAIAGKSASLTHATGYRLVMTTGGAIQVRVGSASRVDSATKTLTVGLYYVWHAVLNGTDLRFYVDGTLIGAPPALTSYSPSSEPMGIGALGDGSAGIGAAAAICGSGTTDTAMSAGQIADHVAAIKAAKRCIRPALGAAEWNWSAEDAGASWVDEGQGATATRIGAGWTYGTEASPVWGS